MTPCTGCVSQLVPYRSVNVALFFHSLFDKWQYVVPSIESELVNVQTGTDAAC